MRIPDRIIDAFNQDEEDSATPLDAPVFVYGDEWGDSEQESDWDDASAPDTGAIDGDFTRHELLTAQQERELAKALQDAFTRVQMRLAHAPALLARLLRHIVEEQWQAGSDDDANTRWDTLVTLYDTWETACYLAAHQPAHQAEAAQVWEQLLDALRRIPLDRDLVLECVREARNDRKLPAGLQARLQRDTQHLFDLRNRLITSNIRLVYFVARRHLDRGMELEDMVQEGILGLIRAAIKFDPDTGNRFSTYAFWWIRQAIRQALTRQRSLIRYPGNLNQQISRMYAFMQQHQNRTGTRAPADVIQRATGLSRKTIRDLQSLSNRCVSADAPRRDGDDRTLLDELHDEATLPLPDAATEALEDNERITRLLATLTPREATVLRLKYGIGQRQRYSLNDIAPQIGLTRERIRQIADEALTKLRRQQGEPLH